VVQGLAIGLVRRGHRVTVLGTHVPGADLEPFFRPMRDAGVAVLGMAFGGRAYLAERKAVAAAFDTLAADVVHAHGYRPDLLHRGAAQRRGMAVVSTLHGTSQIRGLPGLYEWIHERTLRRSEAVIAVSKPIESHLLRHVRRERLHLVQNAWAPIDQPLPRGDARRTLGLPADGPVIGWVGRLVPVKGPDLFLETLHAIRERPWTACIVGDGPERAALEAQATTLGLGDRVRFAGAIPDAGRLIPAFDLFALTSRSEGTPIALLEAIAAGTAVAAFGVGGVPLVVQDGAEAWVRAPGATSALAEAFAEALAQPETRRARAAAATVRLARDFGVEPWLDRHERIYRDAISRRR